MHKNEERQIDPALIPQNTEEIVSDMLYTVFQAVDEYVTYQISHGTPGEELRKMQNYIEEQIRAYAWDLYKVEVDET